MFIFFVTYIYLWDWMNNLMCFLFLMFYVDIKARNDVFHAKMNTLFSFIQLYESSNNAFKIHIIIWLSNLSILNVPDEDYSRTRRPHYIWYLCFYYISILVLSISKTYRYYFNMISKYLSSFNSLSVLSKNC